MSKCLAIPVVQDVAGETHLFPTAPRVLKQDPHDWRGREEMGKEADMGHLSC